MKKLILFLCVCFFVVGGAPAFAISINVWDVDKDIENINNWISAQKGSVDVLENFEGIDKGWYTEENTGVGTFTAEAEGDIGTGASSYNGNHDESGSSSDPYFSIRDTADWYGRSNTTIGEDAGQWLDSGDITLLTLTLKDTSLTNLFFYIQDPAEFSTTTLSVNDNNSATNNHTFSGETDKASFFVGISLDDDEVLSTLSWSTESQSDGFGLDDFSTIHNPEPATMLLFGFGLIGIAGITRRMI